MKAWAVRLLGYDGDHAIHWANTIAEAEADALDVVRTFYREDAGPADLTIVRAPQYDGRHDARSCVGARWAAEHFHTRPAETRA